MQRSSERYPALAKNSSYTLVCEHPLMFDYFTLYTQSVIAGDGTSKRPLCASRLTFNFSLLQTGIFERPDHRIFDESIPINWNMRVNSSMQCCIEFHKPFHFSPYTKVDGETHILNVKSRVWFLRSQPHTNTNRPCLFLIPPILSQS